ncbi:Ubiquitin-conjugating enzyme E2 15 [Elasticomyces elasticus]|nr:Ubiquitin-conjugating enzyme E2 15 [Elasticomyces elasticus]KAK3644683.1 Ubiquitin-conjugating enzyme E2 15 [Elasticomyces elasticus]KAK4916068.1 Ubiquitin-conjugating enzyme E2 15 [Elasticomyces elasticus]KAK5755192.1 Ubiquitin-conjugating enzyme E2 15 [Elasticomyces elasticus]
MPPSMTFTTPLFHPNIYPTGSVCISILHPPEDDKYGYESAAERWSPVQTPESILLSVISMLGSPNDESPANPEAGRLWREDKKEYRKRVRKCVRDSQESGEEPQYWKQQLLYSSKKAAVFNMIRALLQHANVLETALIGVCTIGVVMQPPKLSVCRFPRTSGYVHDLG